MAQDREELLQRAKERAWDQYTDTVSRGAFVAGFEYALSRTGEPVAWLYTENRAPSGRKVQRVRISQERRAISPEDYAEFEITEQPLFAHPVPEQDGWREQERITTAAIKSDGVIVTVERPLRHGSCINFLNAHGLEYREGQGFLTSTGRFVDRQEAGLIAKAAGQGEPRDVCNGNLFSEDMWDEPTLPEQEAV